MSLRFAARPVAAPIRVWLLLALAVVPGSARAQHSAAPQRPLDASAWRSDLKFLASELRRVHPDPFAMCGEARFDSAVRALDGRIPALDPQRVATGLLALTALLQDGHSGAIAMQPPFGFTTFYPLRMTVEDGDLYVVSAAPAYRALVGGRVVTLGTRPAREALEKVLTVCSGDNDFSRLDRAPLFLMSPGVLHALGIAADEGALQVEVERAGADGAAARRAAKVAPVAPEEGRYPAFFQDPEGLPVAGGVSYRDGSDVPLHLRDPDRAWWFADVPERRMVYVMFRRVDREDDGRTFSGFVDSLFTHVDGSGAEYLVIDLRHNGGGDNTVVQPLIHALICRESTVGRPGHLYAIIGRETFSAAMNTVNWIEEHTHARFVGEPTGARPNHFGDATTVRLPASGMPVRISQYRWAARFPWDARRWIAPHVPAPPSMALTRAGRDPALEAIFEEIEHGPMIERLRAALEAEHLDEARALYFADKELHPDRWGRTSIRETTELAQTLFHSGHAAAAFALAQWNTELYPDVPDVWVSLGAGYVMAGRPEAAREPLRRALSLDPDHEGARRWLERAEGGGHGH